MSVHRPTYDIRGSRKFCQRGSNNSTSVSFTPYNFVHNVGIYITVQVSERAPNTSIKICSSMLLLYFNCHSYVHRPTYDIRGSRKFCQRGSNNSTSVSFTPYNFVHNVGIYIIVQVSERAPNTSIKICSSMLLLYFKCHS